MLRGHDRAPKFRRSGEGPALMSRLVPVLLAAAVVAGVVTTFLQVSTGNPPGFYRDESGIALNAALLGQSGRDEYGTLLPLYLFSYGDYKSTPYVYVLAAVFAVTGESELVARGFSAVLGLAAVLVLGLVGHRLSGSRSVGLATCVLAAATPWLFEVTRLVFEVALEPLLVALLVLLLSGARKQATWTRRRCAGIGVTLAAIAYAYAGGRALAPLLALGLLVFATGPRRRSVLMTLGWFGLALLPMAAYVVANPRALLVRFSRVDASEGSGRWGTVTSLPGNLLRELDLVTWVVRGDENLRHHVAGTGSLLAGGVLLALAGAVVLVRTGRWEPFWSYVLLGCVASAVPAAISDVRLHTLRSVGLPVFLIVLAVPALAELRAHLRRPRTLAAALVVTVLVLSQAVVFRVQHAERGPQRVEEFHAQLRPVLRAALAAGREDVVVHRNDVDARGNVTWYAELWDEPVTVLPPGAVPAPGSVVVAVTDRCEACTQIAEAGMFVAYVAR